MGSLLAAQGLELMEMGDLPPRSREMLLDDFMDGLLYKLYQQKWHRLAKLR